MRLTGRMRLGAPLAAFVVVAAAACGGGIEPTAERGDAGIGNASTDRRDATSSDVRTCPSDVEPSGACQEGDRCKYALVRLTFEPPCKKDPYGVANNPGPGSCECLGGEWSCVASKPSVGPVMMCPEALRTVCASGDACSNNCQANEECFTRVSCVTASDGQVTCSRKPGGLGDDRCHRTCNEHTDCPVGEDCTMAQFFGCTADDSRASGRGICCLGGSNCQ